MNFLWQLNRYARLAVFLCLSLCAHLAILYILSWSSFGARHIAPQPGNRQLTVILPDKPPRPLQEKDIHDKPVVQDSATSDINKPGSKFALSEEGISLAVDLHYFSLNELDERPVVIQDIPHDPPELLDFPQGGQLILRLWINKEGGVVNAEPVSSELPQVFIDSARNNFLKARFAPGRVHGAAVDTVMDVVLLYAPKKK